MAADLESIEHDARIEAGELKGEKRLGGCEDCPAPLDFPADYRERVCPDCARRAGVDGFTGRLLLLFELQEGGCAFERDELTIEEWRGLARIRAFRQKMQAGIGGGNSGV